MLRLWFRSVLPVLVAFLAMALSAPAADVTADDLVLQAKIKMARKLNAEAIPLLLQANKLKPKDAEITNMVGIAYLRAGNMGGAVTFFRRSIKMNKQEARFHNNLGTALHMRKDYKGAIRAYKEALSLNQEYLLAYYNLANAYFARKMNLQAIDVLHKIVQLDPDYLTKDRSETEVSVGDLNRCQRLFYLAKLYIQAGNREKALQFLGKAVECGFKDWKTLKGDKDFDPLREDPAYQSIVGGH